ncbi:uncharacterized protein NPIL_394191 [Nephila pilipes]|uniref:Methyltransferase domain-containing protein n=1 Tax=Nephila pilipes TaxID=299642 RepID=A0A8X6TNQ5_NEPPI|nr:uncharacterized protein NPIL_394191 [Nephila pilipes]
MSRAREFIIQCKTKLKWEDLSEDTVMNVGSGTDFFSCRAILEQFPNVKRVITLDHPYIHREAFFWNKNFDHRRVEFRAADIETRVSLQDYEGKINKIVSWNKFHEIRRKEWTIENMFYMLKPGGSIAIWFHVDNPDYVWLWKMISIGKWNQYKTDLLRPYISGDLGVEYYKERMQEAGFHNVLAVMKYKLNWFNTDQDCLGLCNFLKCVQ